MREDSVGNDTRANRSVDEKNNDIVGHSCLIVLDINR